MELLATEAVLPISLSSEDIGIFVFPISSGVHMCKNPHLTSISRAVIVKNKLDKLELTITALKLIGRWLFLHGCSIAQPEVPEGVDNRYTKRITGENVGSTASVARNSHAMVTLVIFFSFFSRHKKGILFKCFWSDMGFGTAHALKFWYKSYIREFFVRHPVCYVPLSPTVPYHIIPYILVYLLLS